MERSRGEESTVGVMTQDDESTSGVRLARQELESSCGPCPERESALRRSLLCRCPVALAARLLLRSEHRGFDAALLTPAETASLAFQERALREPPVGWEASHVRRALELPVLGRHDGTHGSSCLACRSAALARRALSGDPPPN